MFSALMVFMLTLLVGTAANDLWGGKGQAAAVVQFADNPAVSGAVVDVHEIDREGNVNRLRSKIAAGEGNSPFGEPVFTSVDETEVSSSTVTDESGPVSILLGQTTDGIDLWTHDLWRFVGYSQFDQIGISLKGHPIFGSRADNMPLDACGGVDDGSGYKLYLQTGIEVSASCF